MSDREGDRESDRLKKRKTDDEGSIVTVFQSECADSAVLLCASWASDVPVPLCASLVLSYSTYCVEITHTHRHTHTRFCNPAAVVPGPLPV